MSDVAPAVGFEVENEIDAPAGSPLTEYVTGSTAPLNTAFTPIELDAPRPIERTELPRATWKPAPEAATVVVVTATFAPGIVSTRTPDDDNVP